MHVKERATTMIEIKHNGKRLLITGPKGNVEILASDEAAWKLMMLIEGECEPAGRVKVAGEYGYCRQRYYQLLDAFRRKGTVAMASAKRGPKTNYRRTPEVTRQVIRYRFLDPDAPAGVMAQKMRQNGLTISTRSVARIIQEYGLQKNSTHAGRRRTMGRK